MTSLLPSAVLQFADGNGFPYAGGSLAMFEPGTFTPRTTFIDAAGTIPNTNPIVLDADGRCTVYGASRYRMVLSDRRNNLIWDGETEAYLGDSTISPVMLPVVGAATLAEARRLMEIDDAIQLALNNISLMPGPTGPTGPQGVQGIQGIQGPAGSAAAGGTVGHGNPGFIYFPDTGYLCCFGNSSTGGTGVATLGFPKQFSNVISVVCTTSDNPINLVPRVAAISGSGFSVLVEDTDNTRGFACNFQWVAHGFG